MATFRSRQRANKRRDGSQEIPAKQDAAPAPADRPAATQDSPRRRLIAPAAPAPATPGTQERPPAPRTAKTRQAPQDATGAADARRRQIPPAADTPPAGQPDTPHVRTGAKDTRRRLITPAAEAGQPDTPHAPTGAKDTRRRQTAPADDAPQAGQPQPDTPHARTGAKDTRRRLITPADEAPARDRPHGAASRPDTAEAARPAPARAPYVRDQRRGLPANDLLPTERPAFERRSAQPRQRPGAPAHLSMFASCPRGLETVLQQELQRLGAEEITAVDGGVGFTGSLALLMRVNLESRVASRVLLRLARGACRSEREINALAMQIDWPRYFDVSRTIKVKTDGVGARVKSLDYVSLTVKDAVCDRFRQAQLGRPSVDTRAPDIRIQVFLGPDEASIYLDSSGEALFKRGWRQESGEAPLRENLAAGILLLCGYNGTQALLDPMCGSGTFLVEAADIALNRAPGRSRAFAFEQWRIFDQPLWTRLREEARAAEQPVRTLPIHGSDRDARMVDMARANLERAGLSGAVVVETRDLFDCRPHAAEGLLVTNPPYGVRLEEQDTLAALYPAMGDWLKQHFAGWSAQVFTGDLRLPKLIRLTVKRRTPLFNGALECRLFTLPLIAGSARDGNLPGV